MLWRPLECLVRESGRLFIGGMARLGLGEGDTIKELAGMRSVERGADDRQRKKW